MMGFINVDEKNYMPIMGFTTVDLGCERGNNAYCIEHYRSICSGSDIGLAVVEHCYVDISGKAYPNQLSVADDSVIPGLARLAECMKESGTKAFLQLNHCGSLSSSKYTGMQPMSASDILAPKSKETPRPMTIEEIHCMTAAFAEAAKRVKKAGFDGVEIHAAHSYLLNQFYSPLTNKRSEAYGGSRENRLRFSCEVLTAVRAAVGDDFPISVRLGACDYMTGRYYRRRRCIRSTKARRMRSGHAQHNGRTVPIHRARAYDKASLF